MEWVISFFLFTLHDIVLYSKTRLGRAWSNLVYRKMSLPTAEGWNWRIFKIPSNPNHFRILCCGKPAVTERGNSGRSNSARQRIASAELILCQGKDVSCRSAWSGHFCPAELKAPEVPPQQVEQVPHAFGKPQEV